MKVSYAHLAIALCVLLIASLVVRVLLIVGWGFGVVLGAKFPFLFWSLKHRYYSLYLEKVSLESHHHHPYHLEIEKDLGHMNFVAHNVLLLAFSFH